MKRIAVIDLGSNTFRLALFEYEPGVSFRQTDELRAVVRLASGMSTEGEIGDSAYRRGVEVIRAFGSYCSAAAVDDVRATATSAVREAGNGSTFLADAQEASGMPIELLEAEEEARYGALAVANSFSHPSALVLDLGGGSAQLSLLRDRRFEWGVSKPLGAVRMSDRYMTADPPTEQLLEALRRYTRKQFEGRLSHLPAGLPLIGMGGTVRNLARIHQKRTGWPLDFVHGYSLNQEELSEIVTTLAAVTEEERAGIAGLNRDRAGIILAGAVVIEEVMRATRATQLTASAHGLREGLFYPFLVPDRDDHLVTDVRAFSITNLARRYHDSLHHPEQVRRLALELFESLRAYWQCDDTDRELLAAAALVHDVGAVINYHSHHKHGFYLVMGTALPGYTHREQAIIGLLTRFHHKGKPDPQGLGALLSDGDMPRVNRLTAMLRLAEHLDRAHASRVSALHCEMVDGRIVIEVMARQGESPDLEVREAWLSRGLLEESFGIAVEVVPSGSEPEPGG